MTKLSKIIRSKFEKVKPIPAGIYHYQSSPDADYQYRLHLRVEPDGTGILLVNASTVLHLNQTATEFAFYIIKHTDQDEVIKQVSHRYNVSKEQAKQDFTETKEKIFTIINMPDLDPVTYLGIDRDTPYSGDISAPYRLDCAITYRLPEGVEPDIAPIQRVDKELSKQEWEKVIDIAWEAGIPHLIFTGGEPTLRDDLPALISHAENNGQVTGLLSDGLRLSNHEYLSELLQAGLDHLMIILQPHNEHSWKALETILPEDLYTTVHITVNAATRDHMKEILTRLSKMGSNAISLSTSSMEFSQDLENIAQLVTDLQMDLVWDLPVPYSELNPVALETAEDKLLGGAGRAWLYIEPDGDVLPGQGINNILGNILKDPWSEIWKNRLTKK